MNHTATDEQPDGQPLGLGLSEWLGAVSEASGWQPVNRMPPLVRGTMGMLECRNLLVWIDEPHTKGFAKGGCYKFHGETQASFRAEGYNGDWNITHWMRIEAPNGPKGQMMNTENVAAVGAPVEPSVRHHEWDDDGCCIHCGFDGAEWHWWKHSTYEGRVQPEARQPLCKEHR